VSPTAAPYGTWTSPISAALLVEQAVRISQLQTDGGRIYWNEGRPGESGRQVIVSVERGTAPRDVIPAGYSARTQVHEYGGRCYAVDGDAVVFSNWADQRLWLTRALDGEPVPLTPEPDQPRAERYADPVISPDGRWVICVREQHGAAGQVDNDLVVVALDPPDPDRPPNRLTSGHDFYGAPRLSPDGSRLAWITWDHPNMPWDATELWVADFGPDGLGVPVRMAGEPGESVIQPRWSPAGVLHYLSDRSGWWNLYDESGSALCPLDAEFGGPDWVFGNASYGFLPDGRLVAAWTQPDGGHLGLVSEGRPEALGLPLSHYDEVQPVEGGVVAIAGSPTVPPAVVWLDLSGGMEVLHRSREVPIDEAMISTPDAIEFPTGGGETAHALVYMPRNSRFAGPEGERPPLMVISHGGPTSSAMPVFNLAVQYWTSRGFAVADVDYRGSCGYGREYRRRLAGTWGIVDVEDCAHVVKWLAGQGLVDSSRAVIRGGSAGGYTTLAALAFTDTFAAGASHYGVADLELLARDTHKFEARYLDGLVGPWPLAADEYQRRSPIHHVDLITCPLILFQGLEDAVVPPAQSQLMFDALRERGVPVAYQAFAGEQHGFRMATTIVAVAEAELAFYGRVLGFAPDIGPGATLEIANEERLSPRA